MTPTGEKTKKTYSGLNPVADDEGKGVADWTVNQESQALALTFSNFFWSTLANKPSIRNLLSTGYDINGMQLTRTADFYESA